MWRRLFLALTLTLALYGFAGWVYIALIALIHPNTLGMQLSHLTPWLREDTFGALCFAVSAASFLAHQLVRPVQQVPEQVQVRGQQPAPGEPGHHGPPPGAA